MIIQLPVPRGNASLPHGPDQQLPVSRGNASLHVHPRPAQTMGGEQSSITRTSTTPLPTTSAVEPQTMWRRFCSTWTTRFGSIERWGGKQPQVRHFMLNTAHATPYLASVSFPPTLPYTCVLRLHTVATPRTTRRPNELDNDISSQSGPLVACLLFSSQLSFSINL